MGKKAAPPKKPIKIELSESPSVTGGEHETKEDPDAKGTTAKGSLTSNQELEKLDCLS